MTAWDRRTFVVTFAMGALLFAVACAISGVTDEGSIAWTTRAARTVPLVPVCGAVVTFLALRRAERRGEMLALESIGCSPARASAYVVAAAVALGVVAAISVAFFRGPALEAFFPRASAHGEVRVEGDGFADGARGIRIDRDGDMTRETKEAASISPASSTGRAASAAILTALLAMALPLVAARAFRRERAIPFLVAGGICALCTFLAQAAAAVRAPAVLACAPAALLLVYASVRYRSPAW